MNKILLLLMFISYVSFFKSQSDDEYRKIQIFNESIDEFNIGMTLDYLKTLNSDIENYKLLNDEFANGSNINYLMKLMEDKYNFKKSKKKITDVINDLKEDLIKENVDFDFFLSEIEIGGIINEDLLKKSNYEKHKVKLLENKEKLSYFNNKNVASKEKNDSNSKTNKDDIENQDSFSFITWPIIIIVVLLLFVIFLFTKLGLLNEEFEKYKNEIKSSRKTYSKKDNNQEVIRLRNEIEKLENTHNQYLKEINDLKIKLSDESYKNESPIKAREDIQEPMRINKILYLRSPINAGYFSIEHQSETPEFANSMFSFELTNDNQALFNFCGDYKVLNFVIQNPEKNIEKVCEYQNSINEFSSKIESIEPGLVELKNDKWVVIKRNKIKFS